jgi:hypothetical protein
MTTCGRTRGSVTTLAILVLAHRSEIETWQSAHVADPTYVRFEFCVWIGAEVEVDGECSAIPKARKKPIENNSRFFMDVP